MQSYTGSGLKNVSLLNNLRGDALSKLLAGRYGAMLQKIGLECSRFSVSLQIFRKLWYGIHSIYIYRSDCSYLTLTTAKLTQGHSQDGYYRSSLPKSFALYIIRRCIYNSILLIKSARDRFQPPLQPRHLKILSSCCINSRSCGEPSS